MERQVQFTRLHEKRGEVIAQLHGMLCDAESALSGFELSLKLWGDGDKEAANTMHELSKFARRNSIYFSAELATTLFDLTQLYGHPIAEYEYVCLPDESDSASERKERFNRTVEQARMDIRTLRQNVEDEFRAMLGVQSGAENRLRSTGYK